MLNIKGNDKPISKPSFKISWAYAERVSWLAHTQPTRKCLKFKYLGQIKYDFQKSRVTRPAKKTFKKISCWCTSLNTINICGILYNTPYKHNSFKGTVSEDFCFWFFSWISFPQAPDYTIRAVSNFLRKFTSVVDTGVKWKKSWFRKFFIISFGHLWVVALAYM